jgi:hypothetical protein
MEILWRDLKYGIRTLVRSPGFTVIAVLTLTLGIGANTAIFSVVHSVLLAPLPYRQSDQLVIVWEKIPPGRFISPSYPDVQDWQRNAHSFQAIAAFTSRSFDLTGPGAPAHLDGWEISAAFFNTLGVTPVLGREFSAGEDQPGAAHVAMISERLWRERFSGTKDVVGKLLTLDGASYTIVGVLPPGSTWAARLMFVRRSARATRSSSMIAARMLLLRLPASSRTQLFRRRKPT